MPVYLCKDGPLTVVFGYDSFTFSKNQLVNTNFPQVTNHPSFELVTDEKLVKRAPPISKIFPLPVPSSFLSNEDLVKEIRKYGVEPNPYELTDKLSYQLDMLRSLNRRSNITVLDDDGEPMWYEEFVALDKHLKDEARKKSPINTPEVKVSQRAMKREPNEYKLSTRKDIKKKGGSIGAIEQNDDYDIGREHEVDALIKEQINNRFKVGVDKVINDKEDLFHEDDVEVDTSDMRIKGFEYLIELKPFCLEEFTEEQRENLKYKNLKQLTLPAIHIFLRNKGKVVSFGRGSERGFLFREYVNNMYKESPNKEEYIIEINALIKRHREIESFIAKDTRKCSIKSLKLRISRLKHYGMDATYTNNLTLYELRRLYTRYILLTQFGYQDGDHERVYNDLKKYELEDIVEDYLSINTNDNYEEQLST